MKKTQHTQGPWSLGKTRGPFQQIDALSHYEPWEAFANVAVKLDGNLSGEGQANARLIAAAPDLLEVLQELEESSSYWSDYDVPVGIVDRIKTAIARATGKES